MFNLAKDSDYYAELTAIRNQLDKQFKKIAST